MSDANILLCMHFYIIFHIMYSTIQLQTWNCDHKKFELYWATLFTSKFFLTDSGKRCPFRQYWMMIIQPSYNTQPPPSNPHFQGVVLGDCDFLPFESSCDRLHHKIVTIYSNNITERSNKVRWYILGDIYIYITMKQQLRQVQSDARKINSAHAYSSVRVYQLIEGHIRHSTITQLLRNSISFATPLQRLLNIILIFKA